MMWGAVGWAGLVGRSGLTAPAGLMGHPVLAWYLPTPQRQQTTTTTTEAAVGDGSVGVVVAALCGRPSGQMHRGPQEAAWIVVGFRRRAAPCAWDVGGRTGPTSDLWGSPLLPRRFD